MTRDQVMAWVAGYEGRGGTRARTAGPSSFTTDPTYLVSPRRSAISGLAAIGQLWDAGRQGPDEAFRRRAEPVAVDGDTAAVRVSVECH